MELKGKKINFLGDSITEGAYTSSPDKIYLNVLKSTHELSEARNYGIGGTNIARQLLVKNAWDSQSFVDRYVEMNDDADIVVIFGGTNDYGHGDAPIGEFTDRTHDTFYGACHILMEGLINKYPSSTIVFMTPLKRNYPIHSDIIHSSKKGMELIAFVNIIIEVAAYYSIPVLDLYSVSGLCPAIEINNKKYFYDGLHPNDEGHKVIASRLAGFLESL